MEKEQVFKIIQWISVCLTQPFLYIIRYYFYKRFLGFKSKPWKFSLCALLLIVIDFYITIIGYKPLRIIIYDVILLIIICFLCKGNFIIKLYAVIVENVILLLINLTFLTLDFDIIPIIHKINMSFNGHMIIGFISNMVNDLIRFGILFIFLKKICDFLNLKEKSVNMYQSLYLLIPCMAIYGLSFIFYTIQVIRIDDKKYYFHYVFPRIYYLIPIISATLLISILIIAYTFKKMLEGEKNMLMEQQFKLQLKYSKNIEGLYDGIRGIKHDMNNHLSCLRSLANTNNVEEIKKYLYNIGQTVSKLDFEIKTGNAISDSVINEKYNIAKANKIEFICDFMIPKEISVESIDLCVILSNVLDNALEACLRITDSNIHKLISIKSYIRNIYLIIEVYNTTTDKIQYDKNKIISTKIDKYNHGIGISNIKNAAKKYNGVVDINEEQNKFTITIMLKMK
ncbi:sensor histidine kinase [Clostridium brassicae]|uniref:GHKL domain-containing protein n=1 Tax=Clostridium brassicae TaxID=2999072 RepID=A0ABT4D7N7_9CLOT|nr:sensor histidine kinase [Clostridium brassicae]MCY6958315.1 GHKL domain-containing protein [Clostridium brassicae]